MRTLPTLLALATLVAGPVLMAAEGEDRPKRHDGERGHGAELKKFDTNGDGKLDDAEKAAMRAAVGDRLKKNHPELFTKLDTNGDGALSEDEMKAGREKMRELHDKKEKADTNGDGKVDDAERAAKRAEMAEKLKAKHPELFAKLDTNGDGTLSEEEAKAGREQLKELRKQHGEGKDGEERPGKGEGKGEGKGDGEGRKHGKKKDD